MAGTASFRTGRRTGRQDPIPGLIISGDRRSRTASRADRTVPSIKETGRSRTIRELFSKIRTNPAYHPGKSTVLALAVALKLDLADTADLLARAEYALSPGSVGDLIVRYFIEHGIYDLQVINTALNEYDQPILG